MKTVATGLAALAVAIAAPAHSTTIYGVDEVNNLISFNSSAPGTTLSSVAITGLSGSSILGIDIRVKDKLLYGLTDDERLFTINKATGAATFVANLALTGTNFAFDFNPTNANLRIVSNDNSNYVRNFTTNALVPGVNVAYGAGPLFGIDPDITAAGYTNNDNNPATGTTLYVIDSRNDVLATQNPATGVLTRIGALGFNVGSRTSFDIFGPSNLGFVQNGSSFYLANLGTGALTSIGNTDRTLFGIAAAVPEPASWAMLIAGFGAIGTAARANRRRTLQTVTA